MSGYMTAQGLLKTLLLTCASFGASDVTEGDFRVLDSGSTNTAVLLPGAIPNFDIAGLVRQVEYEAIMDLFTRFVDDTTYNTFGTLRDAVISTLNTGSAPALSAVYFITLLRSDSDPIELFDKQGNGPFFITQRFRITIEEQV